MAVCRADYRAFWLTFYLACEVEDRYGEPNHADDECTKADIKAERNRDEVHVDSSPILTSPSCATLATMAPS